MMGKLTVLFLIIFLAVLSLLAFFNKESVSLTIWKGVTYQDIPIIGVIFISTALGIISMFLITAVRETRRHLASWHIQRREKKEAKVLDSYSRGLEAYFASRYDEAAEMFQGVLDYDPGHLNSLLRLGDIHFIRKEYLKAEGAYLKAKEIKPRSIEVLLSLERVAETQKNWQSVIKYLDDILEIDSENIKILRKKRDIYEKTGKWEELLDVQHKILKCELEKESLEEEERKLLGFRYEMGRDQLEKGHADKALKTLKSVTKADKGFIAAYLSLADAHAGAGNDKEVRAILLKGYEETSSMVFLVRLEDYFINRGEPGTIIDIYQKAVQKNQKNMGLQFFLAKLYYRLEMIDYALDTLNGIDISAFDYPEVHALLGSVYERRAEYEKAADEFRKALDVDKRLLVPYCCSSCHHTAEGWSGRCPACRRWNTYVIDINEICTIQKRQSSS
ncbi:MAG: tetratricopeptide repeat protein [Nitrospiraceae bacterium]|nr:MAG: tetratricopeptide repeat protein [Nitrospiraceae bacterium]